MNQRRFRLPTNRRWGNLAAIGIMLTVLVTPIAVNAASQSYDVLNGNAQTGMLVSLTGNSGVIEPATDKNASFLQGVITTSETALDVEPGQVSVQTDGEAKVLVSTLGGDIEVGDRITPSTLAGIGMKATASSWIVGIAQSSFNDKTPGSITSTVTDTKGDKHTVHIASIPVVVHVTYYTVPSAITKSSLIPGTIQRLADAIAGKHASVLGLVLAFILVFTGLIVAGLLIGGAVRAGIAAVARQPLSKRAVDRTVLKTVGVASLVLAGGFIGALILVRIL